MRGLLAGADLPRRRAGVHDPFAFRAQPQVDGVLLDALDALDRVLAVELNAAAENPLLTGGEEPAALASGNFHAGALALARAGLRGALAQAASLVAARTSALLDDRFSGLRGWLAGAAAADPGAMALEYTAQAAAAEVRLLATPAAAQHASVGGGMESHASFAPLAARQTDAALRRYDDAVATARRRQPPAVGADRRRSGRRAVHHRRRARPDRPRAYAACTRRAPGLRGLAGTRQGLPCGRSHISDVIHTVFEVTVRPLRRNPDREERR